MHLHPALACRHCRGIISKARLANATFDSVAGVHKSGVLADDACRVGEVDIAKLATEVSRLLPTDGAVDGDVAGGRFWHAATMKRKRHAAAFAHNAKNEINKIGMSA